MKAHVQLRRFLGQTVFVRLDIQVEEIVWIESLFLHAFEHIDVAEVGKTGVVDLDVAYYQTKNIRELRGYIGK